ncbi:Uncharacterised protein [Nocardia farcinica]|uniref:Uncharacterized protein n=1 Tax=Nocardia farcinica TaxID=37329 RepID=A0A449H758_NOCFR|nr:hypothetical protein [Nocardia farcinica]VFA93890.1 Uncharacterised protein [Nocardia farcinica]
MNDDHHAYGACLAHGEYRDVEHDPDTDTYTCRVCGTDWTEPTR